MNHVSKLIIFITIAFVSKLNAQEFSGIATYKSHRKVDFNIADDDKNAAMKKQLYEQIRKQSQKTYFLNFNREESLYKQEEQLAAPAPASNGMTITLSNGSDVLYKNIKEQRYTNANEIFGKAFLIKDSIKPIEWELINETKNIGNYTCFKAEFTETHEIETISAEGDIEDIEKTKTTTAWYTPQIPLSNGPDEFQGLPGLILEINDGELTLICSKLVLNPEKEVDIKEPKRGKEVSQQEYDAILKKKSDEQMKDLKARSRRGDVKIISFGN